MTLPTFGIVVRRTDEEARPIAGVDLSVIGIIGPIPGADPTVFPINTPVKMYSDDTIKGVQLGTAGYVPDAVNAINDQLADFERAAILVIVRTPEGTNADPALRAQETIAHVMGASTQGTGLWAFMKSPTLLAVTPRLIIAPGYTGQMATSLGSIDLTQHGSGYVPGTTYPFTFAGGGSSTTIVQATAHAVANATGGIGQADVVLDSWGAWYTTAPTITIPPPPDPVTATATAVLNSSSGVGSLVIGTLGGGYAPNTTYAVTFSGGGTDPGLQLPTGHALADQFGVINQNSLKLDSSGTNLTVAPTIDIDDPPVAVPALATAIVSLGANPIVATLPGVLAGLVGHAVVESSGTNEIDDENWRETINSQRIIPIVGGVKTIDPETGAIIGMPAAPRVVGVGLKRSFQTGSPGTSWANQPLAGIVGPLRDIAFSIADGGNEGQQLLANNLGIIVRGETGSDFAISSGGFIFIGTDNAGDDSLWQFYNVTRMRDYIELSLMRGLRVYLGRSNIVPATVHSIYDSITSFLRTLQASDQILGYKIAFSRDLNSPEEIRLGHLTVSFACEEPPVLTRITTESSRYRPAIDAMVSQLASQLAIAA